MRWLGLLVVVPGCQLVFPIDASSLIEAAHLPQLDVGEVDITLEDGDVLDTGERTGPRGIVLEPMAQLDPSGPDVTVLRGRDVTFLGSVRVLGTRPFVVVARSIRVEGTLDVSADGGTPGPGGGAGGVGAGAGGAGVVGQVPADSGGGGGGFAASGGRGGDACIDNLDAIVDDIGGASGAEVGDPTLGVLFAGGSGGLGSFATIDCPDAGEMLLQAGAGGGAVQLSAILRIELIGSIDASGGGGGGGLNCLETTAGAGAGAGGGAGGAVYLEAPQIQVDGVVSANGGGGGGGARSDSMIELLGNAGEDGGSGIAPARGGLQLGGASSTSRGGGDGGALDIAPLAGGSGCDHNAGGGGGAAGRIVFSVEPSPRGTQSPAATILP